MFSDALLPVLRAIEPSVLTLLTRGGTAGARAALSGARRGARSGRQRRAAIPPS